MERHWNSDVTLEKIREGTWDVVVLQGHSQETSNQQNVICTDRCYVVSNWNNQKISYLFSDNNSLFNFDMKEKGHFNGICCLVFRFLMFVP